MLLFAIGFNLWLYRLEPTAKIDPNDNTFQFGLIDRTNTIWSFATKRCLSNVTNTITFPLCHFSYLADHWVHNWAVGYNLPYYYSHIPQILTVASYRFIVQFFGISLFQYYHILIYILLSFFPVSVFLALRVFGLSWFTAGLGALLATQASTDGLYGLDPPSFLWRGYGLSSQLFAMIWLPLAIAYAWRWLANTHIQLQLTRGFRLNWKPTREFALAVFFLAATTAGHLGIGMLAVLSVGALAIARPIELALRQYTVKEIMESAKTHLLLCFMLIAVAVFLLSYWIVPLMLHDNFHNTSYWDPVWKFDSYGWKETMARLFNGDLFDFGRAPVFTFLVLVGSFISLGAGRHAFSSSATQDMDEAKTGSSLLGGDAEKRMPTKAPNLFPLAFLFFFWLLMYFGRTTWGGLIDLVPGMKEYHLSRFIVALHAAGFFLAPIGMAWLAALMSKILWVLTTFLSPPLRRKQEQTTAKLYPLALGIVALLLLPPIYQQTLRFNKLNEELITRANENFDKSAKDVDALFAKLRSLPPGRIFAGRGGWWGKKFAVAETPYYMHLSTYGLPTTLWLPETWSMNSDTEQYFSEDKVKDYDLYNIRYVATLPEQETQPFWKLIDETPSWKLYETTTSGYFITGTRPTIVAADKRSFVNVVRQWIQSDYHKNRIFPELTFAKNYPKNTGLPNFKMQDEVTYKTPDNAVHNIWMEPPVYLPPGVPSVEEYNKLTKKQFDNVTILGPEVVDTDMIFKTKVNVGRDCTECFVILKHTYHPSWRATVDGKPVKTTILFPFFIGVPVSTEGTHEIVVSYEPSRLKVLLLVVELAAFVLAGAYLLKKRKKAQ